MSSAATEAPEAAPPPKSRKKLFIILGAVAALALAGGGGGVYYLKQKAKAEAEADEDGDTHAHGHGAEKTDKKDAKNLPAFLAIEPFTVNLADRDGSRYAQVGIFLELDEAKTGDIIKGYMPAIRNNVLILLSRKTAADLLEPEGKIRLAREIQREVLRPLGHEIDLDEANEDEDAGSPPAKGKGKDKEKGKPKGKPAPKPVHPVRAVHFSNFIIQ